MSVSAKDRQIESLQRRLAQERDDHRHAMQSTRERYRALRDSWELFDSYPALEDFMVWLHKIRDAAGPLRSPTYQPGKSADTTSPAERGAFGDRDRQRLDYINRKIGEWTEHLEKQLGPRGALVDEEIPDVSKPICHNPDCPGRKTPQAFDREVCYWCGHDFTDFREGASSRRCWTRDCPQYSKTDQCQHSWQKMEET